MNLQENNNGPEQMDFYAPIDTTDMPIAEQDYEIDSPEPLEYWDEAQPEQPQAEQTPQQPQPPADPQDPEGKRFAYWQSEAAKAKNELEVYRQQLEQVNPYMPIVRYIQENPNILDTIESSLGQQPQQEQGLQRPQPPQKPSVYNPIEAYNDPESESFKWREANEQYREQLAEYLLTKEQMREEEHKRAQEERMFIEQRNQQLREVATTLTTQYGFSQNDAVDFIQRYNDPKSVTLERLIQLYKFEKGMSTPQANPKVQQMLQRQARNLPLPAGIGGGQTQQPISDEEIFNASIAQSAKGQTSVLWRNKQR